MIYDIIYTVMYLDVFTTPEAAKRAGLSLVTLQRWIASGKAKAPKLRIDNGHAVRLWAKKDLDLLLIQKRAIYCRGRGRKKRK